MGITPTGRNSDDQASYGRLRFVRMPIVRADSRLRGPRAVRTLRRIGCL